MSEAWVHDHAEITRLRAQLAEAVVFLDGLAGRIEPFGRNADAVSLSKALGHIEREHIHDARCAAAECRAMARKLKGEV